MTPWDITKSASSHSALAGVLAGLALALLVLLHGGFVLKGRLPEHMHATSSTDSSPASLTPIGLGAALLVISAIIWGELSGYPSAQEISQNLESLDLRDAALASSSSEFLVGTAATILLALGAVLVFGALLQAMFHNGHSVIDVHMATVRIAYAFVAALAAFEVAQFLAVSFELTLERPLISPNIAGLSIATAVFAGTSIRRSTRFVQKVATWASSRADQKQRWILAAWSASVALIGYALTPVHTFNAPPQEINFGHLLSLSAMSASAVILLLFVTVATPPVAVSSGSEQMR